MFFWAQMSSNNTFLEPLGLNRRPSARPPLGVGLPLQADRAALDTSEGSGPPDCLGARGA